MSKYEISQPTPPPQPSTADAINAWVQAMPQVYQQQLEYAPKEAAQQVALAQQYAAPLGQAMYQAQQQMYPETVALQEQLAGQAATGMESGVPDWMRQQYLDEMRAQLGPNALAGAGADYMSRGLMQQQQDWQNYYRNLGLSVAGRQPLTQAATPGTSNYLSGFTPQSTMGFMSSTYGPYAGAYGNMYGANAQLAGQSPGWANALGTIGGSTAGSMFGLGGMFGQKL